MGIRDLRRGLIPRVVLVALLLAPILASTTHAFANKLQQSSTLPSSQKDDTAQLSGAFSSIPIPIKTLPVSTIWKGIYPAIKQARFSSCRAGSRCAPAAHRLADIVRSADPKPFSEKLSFINREINQLIPYKSDMENYGTLDFWASPNQILTVGSGDCEDYAILKMAALAASGVPTKSMSMIVLLDTQREVFHAVLSVATSNGNYILDNLSDKILHDSHIQNYLPLYSMSEERYWLHGRTRKGNEIAAETNIPAMPMPGVDVPKIKVSVN